MSSGLRIYRPKRYEFNHNKEDNRPKTRYDKIWILIRLKSLSTLAIFGNKNRFIARSNTYELYF